MLKPPGGSPAPSALVTELKNAGVRGVLTFSERMQAEAAELAAALGLPGNSLATIDLLTDKYAQRQRLRQAGVPSARCELVARPAEWPAAVARTGLPAVVKPASGEGSRNTYLVQDMDAGAELVGRLLAVPADGGSGEAALVVEEYLSGRPSGPYGDYVSVECMVAAGEVSPLVVDREAPTVAPFREVGQFWPANLPVAERDQVAAVAADAVRALGVAVGLTHTEVKLTAGGPRVIEVNGRLGGNLPDLAVRAAGLDLVEVAGRLALGEPADASVGELDRVFFQYWSPSPCRAGRLEEIRGTGPVRALPGVTAVRQFLRPGAEIAGGVSTAVLEMICAEAPDHAAMLTCIDAIVGRLSYLVRTPDGLVELSGTALRR